MPARDRACPHVYTDKFSALQALALSKLTTPLKRLMPMRLSLIKTLLKGRLQSRGALKPTTASAFTDGPALKVH